MKTTIPSFLLEMSKQMNEQDNRITADPIWQVRHKDYLVTAKEYEYHHFEVIDYENDHNVIFSGDIESLADKEYAIEYLIERDEQWCFYWVVNHFNYDDENKIEFFKENFDFEDNYRDFPDGIEKIYLQEIEKIIKTCLTEADANWFIRRKQHDYPHLYTYVESMVFCPQMIELRQWILGLTDD